MDIRQFDQLFREFDRLGRPSRTATSALPMDIIRREDGVELHVDIPGVDPDSVDLTVEQDHLTISVERSRELGDDDTLVTTERPTGTATRRVFLGRELDPDGVAADVDRGVLKITMPFAASARPRKISIGDSMELTTGVS